MYQLDSVVNDHPRGRRRRDSDFSMMVAAAMRQLYEEAEPDTDWANGVLVWRLTRDPEKSTWLTVKASDCQGWIVTADVFGGHHITEDREWWIIHSRDPDLLYFNRKGLSVCYRLALQIAAYRWYTCNMPMRAAGDVMSNFVSCPPCDIEPQDVVRLLRDAFVQAHPLDTTSKRVLHTWAVGKHRVTTMLVKSYLMVTVHRTRSSADDFTASWPVNLWEAVAQSPSDLHTNAWSPTGMGPYTAIMVAAAHKELAHYNAGHPDFKPEAIQ